MTRLFLAFGPFDPADPTLAAAAASAGGELGFAASMATFSLPQLPRRPDVLLARMDAEDLDEFLTAFHTHPRLEGAPLLAVVPQLTQAAAVRASSVGADDFIAQSDLRTLLPAKLAAAAAAPKAPKPPVKCKVLLADASPLHSRVLTRLLGQAGFDVSEVATGPQLLAQLERPGYGLMILDLALPGCQPRQVLEQARAKLGDATPPVIAMMHAAVPHEDAAAAVAAGCRHVHDKRRPPDELVFLANESSIQDHARLRGSPRLVCALLVGFRRGGGRWEYGLSQNLSLSGLYVRTIDPPAEGSELELEFTPPGSDTAIACRARVAWRKDFAERAARSAPTGMGLQLLDPKPPVQAAMAQAAKELASRGPNR